MTHDEALRFLEKWFASLPEDEKDKPFIASSILGTMSLRQIVEEARQKTPKGDALLQGFVEMDEQIKQTKKRQVAERN